MNSLPFSSSSQVHQKRARAFTLIELLVVVAIMALLLSLSVYGLTSSLQAQHLSASATRLAGELSTTALQAIRENRDIQVRLVRRNSEFNTDDRLRGVQCHGVDTGTGTSSPAGEVMAFDPGVIVFEDAAHSTLRLHQNNSLPDGYCTFRPNGSTDLDKNAPESWCLTLVLERDLKASGGALPANFRTVVINPHTSAVRVY